MSKVSVYKNSQNQEIRILVENPGQGRSSFMLVVPADLDNNPVEIRPIDVQGKEWVRMQRWQPEFWDAVMEGYDIAMKSDIEVLYKSILTEFIGFHNLQKIDTDEGQPYYYGKESETEEYLHNPDLFPILYSHKDYPDIYKLTFRDIEGNEREFAEFEIMDGVSLPIFLPFWERRITYHDGIDFHRWEDIKVMDEDDRNAIKAFIQMMDPFNQKDLPGYGNMVKILNREFL
ncbi:MAG: hypothetical protein J1F16_00350 [Muribaculaceae bacterium]|nr:hypothetical protein [Muribaculaceae bacterium]